MYDRVKQLIAQEKSEKNQKDSESAIPRMTLTVDQMADELHISRTTAYSLVKQQDFPALTIGHRVLVNRAGLQRWLDCKSEIHISTYK